MPEKLKTLKVCLEAVSYCDLALQYVPEALRAEVQVADGGAERA